MEKTPRETFCLASSRGLPRIVRCENDKARKVCILMELNAGSYFSFELQFAYWHSIAWASKNLMEHFAIFVYGQENIFFSSPTYLYPHTDTHVHTDRQTHTQRQTDTHIETDRQTHPQMHTNTCLISLDRSTASSCDGVEPKAFLVPVHIPIRKAWCRRATVPCVNIHRFMGLAVNCVATLVPPFVTLTDGVNMYIDHNDYAYIIIAVQLCSKLIHEWHSIPS